MTKTEPRSAGSGGGRDKTQPTPTELLALADKFGDIAESWETFYEADKKAAARAYRHAERELRILATTLSAREDGWQTARHPGTKAIDAAIAQGKQQLQVALDSQIDITNTEREHAERAARKLSELHSQEPYGWHVYDGTNRITFDAAEAEHARSEGEKVVPVYAAPKTPTAGEGDAQ